MIKNFSIIIPIALGIIFLGSEDSCGGFDAGVQKNILFMDGSYSFEIMTKASTVGELLDEQKIKLNQYDAIFPDKNNKIFSGSKIKILRAKKITIKENGKTSENTTLGNTVEEAIWGSGVDFSNDDFSKPDRKSFVKEGAAIVVTHVQIKEEIRKEDIDFKTVSNEDDKLSWRTKKVTQKGIKGINEVRYRVVYYDGKEISKKILEKNRIKDPVEEIVTQGTFMKLGKDKRGQGTWYAFKGGMFAASTTIPRGGYAKVTCLDNGKSVVVQINDYGPQGKGRIIDLDKVAFQELASLGAGVINVKVEQILN